MRICVLKATGKLLEAQGVATEGTLIRNAINAGYVEADIEERVLSDADFATLIASLPEVIAKAQAEATKTADIMAHLPDWATVQAKFDQGTTALDKAATDLAAATTLAAVRPVVGSIITVLKGLVTVTLGMARVLYWLVKNSAT